MYTPQGDVVITVSAYDGDRGVDDDIVYSLEDGNDLIGGNASFAINNATGVISVNAASLDRETHDTYSLRVKVRGRARARWRMEDKQPEAINAKSHTVVNSHHASLVLSPDRQQKAMTRQEMPPLP